MKYTIRHQPHVPGIDSAHWAIWRPGEYQKRFRGFLSFANADSFIEAIRVVEHDILEAQRRFYAEFFTFEPYAAVLWWAVRNSAPLP